MGKGSFYVSAPGAFIRWYTVSLKMSHNIMQKMTFSKLSCINSHITTEFSKSGLHSVKNTFMAQNSHIKWAAEKINMFSALQTVASVCVCTHMRVCACMHTPTHEHACLCLCVCVSVCTCAYMDHIKALNFGRISHIKLLNFYLGFHNMSVYWNLG